MNDYDLAMEYKKSADVTKNKIDEIKSKRYIGFSDEQKLRVLCEMYTDCLYAYKNLLRRCENENG